MMSFSVTVLALLPIMLLQSVIPAAASPPGTLRYQTIASASQCEGPDTNLLTVGFAGSTGVACTSLADSVPTDFWLVYALYNCSINLFSEAGCADDSIVLNLSSVDGGIGLDCINVEAGFRALNATCTY